MRFSTDKLKLSEAEFTILRDLILERTGLFHHHSKRDLLEDKLSSLVMERGFNSFLDYYYLLKYDTAAATEWERVIEALRVPETFFWREFDQIQALVEVLLPQYVALNPIGPLRIWSAACASGEEPLTIAMALHEGDWFKRAWIEITGSDISATAIDKARNGRYRSYSLRNLSEKLRAKYFREEQGLWRIVPEIHSRVQWKMANLTCPAEVAPLATAHFIYCRNVFIYFTEEMIRKTVQRFFESLPTPGYLFVGAAESLLKMATDFELRDVKGAFVYVKR
jgi:chemotaxis protein methyltransferase CheR